MILDILGNSLDTLIVPVIAIVAVLASGYAYFRSSAVKVWEQNSSAYRARVELLEAQNAEKDKKLAWLEQRVQELEARPDWTQVIAVISVTERNIIKAVKELAEELAAQEASRHGSA